MGGPIPDIVRSALQRSGTHRQAFLDGACGDDNALREQVLKAISAAEDDGGRTAEAEARWPGTTRPAAAGGGVALPGSALERPGDSIGPYKILQLIGEGGFGCVYMAQQSAPVKRRVAVKIVKPGMDSKQVIGRFETERQALAMMDHPNIARVYDAGTTPTGRPYFVMELVKGVPITEYCDSAQLTARARLELFMSVCHAVQHAHHKGIVHRDLKPSNVLVTLHDEKPVVKVIDFGIAKAMNQDLTDRTVFTEFRGFIGTPEYMSPEQAAMSGLDVDTRTDIYSLGVLLYELMCGTTPFAEKGLRTAGMQEIQRIIMEEEPARPSARVSRATRISGEGARPDAPVIGAGPAPAPGAGARAPKTTTVEQIARLRRTDPRTLCRILAGDLDWIVMKALEKDRSRRYETAAAMAEDARRYLVNEPILARPPSTAYRVRKFARRNRMAIGAAGGGACAVVLTLAALSYGLLEARQERDKTAQRETVTRAEMLLASMNSVRAYTADHVRPALEAKYRGEFVREMVPGYSAFRVYSIFRDGAGDAYKGFVYKEATPNPTNPQNRADDFENRLIEQFRSGLDKDSGVRDMNGQPTFYIARPMAISDARCLDCHSTPDRAPPGQVKLYGSEGGYGWKMNEIVASQVVYVPVAEGFRSDRRIPMVVLGGVSGFLVLAAVVGIVLLRKA